MKPFYRRALKVSRYCHLYITLFTLTLILFFAATGFMLNHEDWFLPDNPRETKFEGEIPLALVSCPPTATATDASEDDASPLVDKFEVCEALRKAFGINGVVHSDSFRCDRDTVEVVFGGPGGKTTAEVARDTGKVKITRETNGFAGIITDLHKGKSTGSIWKAGTGWSLLIDAVCIALGLISITGLVLWSSLKSRGKWGAALLLAGTGIALGIYFLTVPW